MITSLKVKDKIKTDFIGSGALRAGDKLPVIRDLARKYEVSYATVLGAIKILAQEGKVLRKQGSGVYLSSERNKTLKKIGYITNSFAQKGAFGYKILEGIERLACRHKYDLGIVNSNFDLQKEKKAVAEFVKGGVGGIIVYPVPGRDSNSEYLADEYKDVPIVVVDLARPEMKRPAWYLITIQLDTKWPSTCLRKGAIILYFFIIL